MGHQHMPIVIRKATQKDLVVLQPHSLLCLYPFPLAHPSFTGQATASSLSTYFCLSLSCSFTLHKPVPQYHRCLQSLVIWMSPNMPVFREFSQSPQLSTLTKCPQRTSFWSLCPFIAFLVTIPAYLESTQQAQQMKHRNGKVPNSGL